ncbi:hypothetical protein BJ322DRAFT_103377 [Thelephora terrestris]|uniref:Zn(2)-C6 fungal-type domain-containing protein n=1 Tax=Thelephora terrestris TaxID=56493 RepID=A0A9P6HTI6_9AGAM|nr:hypothetical protein BJ322DRAFT_103377 [Thelephora terrestris]
MSQSSSPEPSTASTALPRNRACLCCRRKKMKCDGLKPICTPCVRSNRDECKYTDKKQNNRKQILEGKISRLEARLRDLESNGPQRSNSDAASSASYPTPPSTSASLRPSTRNSVASPAFESVDTVTLQQYPAWPSSSSPLLFSSTFTHSSPSPPPVESDFSWPSPALSFTQEPDVITEEEANQLLNVWLSLQYQWGFIIDPITFYTSLFDPDYSKRPHPSLINAILLIATCHPTVSPITKAKSESLLSRVLAEIQLGISQADRLLDLIHASCLLSTYFYTQNRIQEGYYHSTAAARLITTLQSYLPGYSASLGPYNANNRILTLVHVFAVDRNWSVVTGLPPTLKDEDCLVPSVMEALTSFPIGPSDVLSCDNLLPADCIFDAIALRLSAYALHETSHRLVPTDLSTRNQEDIAALKSSAALFHKRFPSFVRSRMGLEPLSLFDAHMAAIHTFVNVSTINLERAAMVRGGEPFKRCLMAVSSIVAVVEQLQEEDYSSLDPLMSSCWVTAANVCLYVISSSRPPEDTGFVRKYADVLIGAVLRLARFYPLADVQARQLLSIQSKLFTLFGPTVPFVTALPVT